MSIKCRFAADLKRSREIEVLLEEAKKCRYMHEKHRTADFNDKKKQAWKSINCEDHQRFSSGQSDTRGTQEEATMSSMCRQDQGRRFIKSSANDWWRLTTASLDFNRNKRPRLGASNEPRGDRGQS